MRDQTPPVASSQQGRTPCFDPTCDCCRVHTRTERELEARIRELEEALRLERDVLAAMKESFAVQNARLRDERDRWKSLAEAVHRDASGDDR